MLAGKCILIADEKAVADEMGGCGSLSQMQRCFMACSTSIPQRENLTNSKCKPTLAEWNKNVLVS